LEKKKGNWGETDRTGGNLKNGKENWSVGGRGKKGGEGTGKNLWGTLQEFGQRRKSAERQPKGVPGG